MKYNYCKVNTVDEEGCVVDISVFMMRFSAIWKNVGINKYSEEESWVEFVCWDEKQSTQKTD